MKKTIVIFLLVVSFVCGAQTQTKSYEIDPRQYIHVLYKKNPANQLLDTIWTWEKRTNVPYQKRTRVDVDGEMKIVFNKEMLAVNKEFEGNISLEGEITGKDGVRKIEVSPYSEVGVERQKVGYESDPPGQIATRFLNMILELKNMKTIDLVISDMEAHIFDTAIFYKAYIDLNEFADLDSFFVSIPNARLNNNIIAEDANKITPSLISLINAINEKGDVYREYKMFLYSTRDYFDKFISNQPVAGNVSNYSYIQLKVFYDRFKNVVSIGNRKAREGIQKGKMQELINAIMSLKEVAQVVSTYLNSFTDNGEDAQKAFFSLINKDNISFDGLKKNIDSNLVVLKGLQLTESEIDKAIKALTPIKRNIKSLSSVLSNISDIEGSKLEQLINNLYKKSTGRDLPRINKEIGPMLSNDTALFNTIRKNYEMLSNMLCEEAGKIIYKKLVYASIDLSKSGAKAGEVLHIYVTWKITKLTGSAVPPRLTIGKYYIRETGWKVEVSDIFSLVERIGENKDNSGTVSPSNFKGAGGAVLMLTYFGEDRGLKITNRGDTYKIHKKNRLLNALQPSIGINISYLDFSTKKDVEIGTALQVGLFRNKIFFGYGLNLHMIRSQDISPRYIFLGLSFAKLEDLFKNTSAGTK